MGAVLVFVFLSLVIPKSIIIDSWKYLNHKESLSGAMFSIMKEWRFGSCFFHPLIVRTCNLLEKHSFLTFPKEAASENSEWELSPAGLSDEISPCLAEWISLLLLDVSNQSWYSVAVDKDEASGAALPLRERRPLLSGSASLRLLLSYECVQ